LGEIASSPCLTPAELKALTSVDQVLSRDEECPCSKVDLKELLMAPEVSNTRCFVMSDFPLSTVHTFIHSFILSYAKASGKDC